MPITLLNSINYVELAPKGAKLSAQAPADSGNMRFQSPLVQPQMATLNTAIATNGFSLHQMLDTIAVLGVITTIGQPPANQDYVASNATAALAPKANSGALVSEFAPQKMTPSTGQSVADALPISSLSDLAIGYPAATQGDAPSPTLNFGQGLYNTQLSSTEASFIDLSLMPLGTPVVISQLPNAQVKMTVIDGTATAVRIADFKSAQSLPDSYINTNLATLNLATPASAQTLVATPTAPGTPGRVDMQPAAGIEISTGITVSGTADGSSVTLLLSGDRANLQTASMAASSLSNSSFAAEMNALAGNFAGEFTPLFLAELSNAPAGDLQIRLIATVSVADADMAAGISVFGA